MRPSNLLHFAAKAFASLLLAAGFLGFIVTGCGVAFQLFWSGPLSAYTTEDWGGLLMNFLFFGGSLATWSLAWKWLRSLDPNALSYRPAENPYGRRVDTAGICFSLLLATFLLHEGRKQFGDWVLNSATALCLFWIARHLFIFAHELGHFIAASIAGYDMQKFHVGEGPLLYKKQGSNGMIWEWRLFPRGGYVIGWPKSGLPQRWKEIYVAAAGPLASILFLATICPAFIWSSSPGRPLNLAFIGKAVAEIIFLWGSLLTLRTILPGHGIIDETRFDSDGTKLLKLIYGPQPSEQEQQLNQFVIKLNHYWASSQYSRAWHALREAFNLLPEKKGDLLHQEGVLH